MLKKTMFYTSHTKRWSYRSILGVILGVIIFSGLSFGLFSKNAFADTNSNYISNAKLYYGSDGALYLEFTVQTTFHSVGGFHMNGEWAWRSGGIYSDNLVLNNCADLTLVFSPAPQNIINNNCYSYGGWIYVSDASADFLAGYTYKMKITQNGSADSFRLYNFNFQQGDYLTLHFVPDAPDVYFSVFPSVSVSYPNDNAQISGAFNVQGSFTIPAGKSANYINISLNPVGAGYSLLTNFSQDITGQNQGSFSIPISDVPAGYYDIIVSFVGGDYDGYIGATIHNVQLVNDIPPALSTGETTPSSPNFNFISPDNYYLQHSNYSTSTGLFNNLAGSVGALIQSVGNSLSAFAGKFSLSDAQQTATMVATSISTIRTYSNNLNSFFGSLPVSQILFLYLIIFVAVIVFRLIKNLVNLIKP